MKFINRLLVLSMLSLSFACSPRSAQNSSARYQEQLVGYNWTLRELTGSKPTEGRKPTLLFTAEPPRVTGFAGCNSFSGAYMLRGNDSLVFGAAAISEMACMFENPEQAFLMMMKNTSRYSAQNGELRLYDGATLLAIFDGTVREDEHAHAHETVTLDGMWELEYITGPKIAFEGLYPIAKPFLTLDSATGKSGGSGSCNGFSGSFVLKGNNIRFGDQAATMMACEGNGEQVFFKALADTDNYVIENDHLLLKKGDITLMKFHRKH